MIGDPSGASGPRRRVAVVFGGRSAEHEISVQSARSVIAALKQGGHKVLAIGVDKQGRWHQVPALPASSRGEMPEVADEAGPEVALSREPGDSTLVGDDGSRREIDVVFPVLHGPFGEDGTIQGLLELADVPYVGAGVLASALGMDKAVQKVLFMAAGLEVVPHEVVHERDWEEDRNGVEARAVAVGLPLFVKPATLGSSVGITKVKVLEELPGAIEEALSHARKAVIERSMEGAREIECAVLGNDDPVASVPGEIIPGGEWYDYRAKYLEDDTRLEVPANLPDVVAEEIRRMAVEAFRAIDGAGMARVDFFLPDSGRPLVNEINTIPGFTPVSMYPKMWEATGMSYPDLVERLMELAIERHAKEQKRGRTLAGREPDGGADRSGQR
jgi:D-alanine-D-alanine ligase